MKIMSIAPACSFAKNKPQTNLEFKGIQGGDYKVETGFGADHVDYDVNYNYYPFFGESNSQIDAAKNKMKEKSINKSKYPDSDSRFSNYYKPVFKEQPALPFTEEEYEKFKSNPSQLPLEKRIEIRLYTKEIAREKGKGS